MKFWKIILDCPEEEGSDVVVCACLKRRRGLKLLYLYCARSGVVFAEGDRKKYEFLENQKLIQKTFDL